jgi:hypothetical protein
MKKLFTITCLACLFIGSAQAQNQTVTTTKSVKMVEKEGLKQAQPTLHKVENAKIEQRVVSARRVDSNNSQGAVMTEEQMKAKMREQAGNSVQKTKQD